MRKVCSGLVLILGLTAAVGQQPPGKEEKPPQQTAPPKPPTDELEAAIVASANHPDVRLAQAKLQMAQAELDQAKLQAVQRLTAAHAKLRSAHIQAEIEEKNYRQVSSLTSVPQAEKWQLERALAQAKAALAAAEAEWQAARGQVPGQAAAPKTGATLSRLVLDDWVRNPPGLPDAVIVELMSRRAAPAPGSAADRLRELVGKRVTLDLKEPVVFEKALAEFVKQAGLGDLTVRTPEWANERYVSNPPRVGPLVGEQTVAGWFQLILDDFNRSLVISSPGPEFRGKHDAYVRDYGLLITKTDLAPPGAPTLAEFARQAQNEKTLPPVKLNPDPEPKK